MNGSAFELGGFLLSFLPGSFFWQTFMANKQPSSGGWRFLASTTVEKAPLPISSSTSNRSSASRVSLTEDEAVTSDLDLPRDKADNDRVKRDDVRDRERDQLFRRGSSLFAVFGSSSACFLRLRRGLDRPKRERGMACGRISYPPFRLWLSEHRAFCWISSASAPPVVLRYE